MKPTLMLLAALLLAPVAALHAAEKSPTPNIVLIIADDLGYRDLGCYGATKIKTPRIDQLAAEGVRFTDAHSVCGVCNPSRYSILSGTYFWHAKRKPDYSLYFHDGQVTLPALLKSAGYHTAALGKWHNGIGRGSPDPDWNGELKPGPIEIGFGSFFGTPKTHNEPPLVFVDGHRVVGLDPADPIIIDKTTGPHGKMNGGAKAQAARPGDRIDLIMAEKASAFFAQQSKEVPFFLYLAFAAPHVPINPAPEFRGKSAAGLYGDFVEQLDHCTGLVLDALEKSGLARNTLVIFTSDNAGMYHRDAVAAGHRTNGELLGQKTDAWEGGHRVPLIARWPEHVPAGKVRNELFTQVDIMATLAEAAKVTLPAGSSPDGQSELAAFTDPEHAPLKRREAEFLGTSGFALRQGDWVYLPYQGSGGMTAPETPGKPWSQPYAKMGFTNSDIDREGQLRSDAPAAQLYHLKTDLAQQTNVIAQHPDIAAKMQQRMDELKLTRRKAPKIKTAGLTAGPNATLLKDGQPYRGIGINYFDCFLRTLKNGDDTSYDAGFATLAAKGIPFARFCATGFWPRDMKLYQTDRAEYFRRLDGVVKSAEKHGIGLVPSLFWLYSCVPDLVGEPMDQWGNPHSKTHAWMREYVREIVTRYRDHPTLWTWEFGNEFSLAASLPNAKDQRPPTHIKLGQPATRSERDEVTFAMVRIALAEFGKAVREHDQKRLILTGDTFRPSAWHQEHRKSWTKDSPDEFAQILTQAHPDPIGGMSFHLYKEDEIEALATMRLVSQQLNKPIFVGEFGGQGETPEEAENCRRLLKGILDHHIPLAALWVFDFKTQKEWSVTADNARAWQLDLISEANKRLGTSAPAHP